MTTMFKTAKQLGLRDEYYRGLRRTLKEMRAGSIQDAPRSYIVHHKVCVLPKRAFSIWNVLEAHECGTVGCVLGYGLLYGYGKKQVLGVCGAEERVFTGEYGISAHTDLVVAHANLTQPPGWTDPRFAPLYTVDRVAIALEAYLTHGRPCYGAVEAALHKMDLVDPDAIRTAMRLAQINRVHRHAVTGEYFEASA